MFLFVAGRLKALEYDCTLSAAFLKLSALKVKGISSSSYKSTITEPLLVTRVGVVGFLFTLIQFNTLESAPLYTITIVSLTLVAVKSLIAVLELLDATEAAPSCVLFTYIACLKLEPKFDGPVILNS